MMRFLATKSGTVHIVDGSPSAPGETSCPAVSRALNAGTWKGQRSIRVDKVSDYNDCAKCQSHKNAKEFLEVQPTKDKKTATRKKPGSFSVKAQPVIPPSVAEFAAVDVKTRDKAKEHALLAKQHGWDVASAPNDHGGLTVTATKGDESCVLTYREGGYLYNPGIVFVVPGRSVPLHNSGTWRRQVSLPDGKRPVSARPKRAGRIPKAKPEEAIHYPVVEPEVEVIPLNKSSLPFPLDADDAEIIDHIKGRTLYWRNNMAAKVVSAELPSKPRLFRFTVTRTGRRCLSFPELAGVTEDGEVLGAERSVAVEDMLRVK